MSVSLIQKRLRKIPPVLWEVLEEYADLPPGGSMKVGLVWKNKSSSSHYQKFVRIRTLLLETINTPGMHRNERIMHIAKEFQDFGASQFATHMVLHKRISESDVVEEVLNQIPSSVGEIIDFLDDGILMEAELRETEDAERTAILLAEIELDNSELPPSAGEDEGEDEALEGESFYIRPKNPRDLFGN